MSAVARSYIRRRSWGGDDSALAHRARHRFTPPIGLTWLSNRGVRVQPVEGDVKGEWILPRAASSGAILYLHGGGYVACSPATYRSITAGLSRVSRRRVFVLDYRLAPEHRFPAAVDDALAGYRWLLEQGVAPGSLAIAGDSAGGGLALALLLRLREERLPQPSCAVCFSPWTDLAGTGASIQDNDGRCAMFHSENIFDFAKAYLGGASPLEPLASPVFGDLTELPPLLLQVGSTEVLLDDARRVHEKVQRTGGSSQLEVFEDVPHVWQFMAPIMPEAQVALRQAAEFMNRWHS